MLYNNILLTVKNEADVPRITELLKEQCRLSLEEPGCARFEVYHSNANPLLFILVEQWESQATLDEHRKAKAYTEIYQPQVLPLVDRVPHPSTRIM